MKTIKHPDTYQCEICGAEYKTQFMAEMCEKRPFSQFPIEIGDNLLCLSRYDGFFEVKIKDIVISNNGFLNWKDDTSILSKIPKNETRTNREIIENEISNHPHNRKFITNKRIEVGKDGSTSNEWDESSCYPNKSIFHDSYPCKLLTWNENYAEMPVFSDDQYCFIKWIEDDDVVIRRGSKSWFDKHWKDKVQFVAFSNVI